MLLLCSIFYMMSVCKNEREEAVWLAKLVHCLLPIIAHDWNALSLIPAVHLTCERQKQRIVAKANLLHAYHIIDCTITLVLMPLFLQLG